MCKIYSISIISFDEDFFPSCMPSGSRFQFCFISVLFVTFLFLSLYTWFNTFHCCLSVPNSVCADTFTVLFLSYVLDGQLTYVGSRVGKVITYFLSLWFSHDMWSTFILIYFNLSLWSMFFLNKLYKAEKQKRYRVIGC